MNQSGCPVLVDVRQPHVGVLGKIDLTNFEMVRVKIRDPETGAQRLKDSSACDWWMPAPAMITGFLASLRSPAANARSSE